MIYEISHIERPIDQRILNPYKTKTKKENRILTAAKDFLCSRFGFEFLGVVFKNGRTITFIEAPNKKCIEKCIKIGTPIFEKLTGCPYEDIQFKEYNPCEKSLVLDSIHIIKEELYGETA